MALNKIQLGMGRWIVFHFEVLAFWIQIRLFVNELNSNPLLVHTPLEVYQLCVNSFYRLKSFLFTYPDSKFTCSTDYVITDGDRKNWFLLSKEFGAVLKHDDVTRRWNLLLP
jgi:hypothetical protein